MICWPGTCPRRTDDAGRLPAPPDLCEHRCGVDRLAGQTGVCRMTLPAVASATLHPAPPESYTVFMAGCNYKCLNWPNWSIAQLPDNGYPPGQFIPARELAGQCVARLESPTVSRPFAPCTTCCIDSGIDTQAADGHTRQRKWQVLVLLADCFVSVRIYFVPFCLLYLSGQLFRGNTGRSGRTR